MDNALTHLAAADPVMKQLIARYPTPVFRAHRDYYYELVRSIISQQLSIKAAATIQTRFLQLFGGAFPSPEQIMQTEVDDLRAVGLSRQKATYMRDLASKIIDGMVRFDTIDSLSNDAVIAELTKVKGIGVWTVHMFLLFCMARLDVLPVGDLGIKNGIKALYDFDHLPTEADVARIATEHNWQPYQSVASHYIWQSLSTTPSP